MNGARMIRVGRDRPCPVCGHADWCLLAADGSAAICPRVQEGSTKRCGDAGWLHVLRQSDRERQPSPRARRLVIDSHSRPDFGGLAEQGRRALWRRNLHRIAWHLGVSPKSLERLGIGWCGHCFAFPMQDGAGRVIGIRTRYLSGKKACLRGSRQGLFTPTSLPAELTTLLVCEGPTDTAAMLDLGFAAVGRPNCSGGAGFLVQFVRARRPRRVVIVADADPEGQGEHGAGTLAAVLVAYVPVVRIILPPEGIKDARDWKRAGATCEDVERAVDAAPERRLALVSRMNGSTKGRATRGT